MGMQKLSFLNAIPLLPFSAFHGWNPTVWMDEGSKIGNMITTEEKFFRNKVQIVQIVQIVQKLQPKSLVC